MENLQDHLLTMAAVTFVFIVFWLRPDWLRSIFAVIRRIFSKKKIVEANESPLTVAYKIDPGERPEKRYFDLFDRPIGDPFSIFYRGGKLSNQRQRRRQLRRSNINQHKH